MRKTIILAIATLFLAGTSVVTGFARTVLGPSDSTISATPMVHPHTIGSLTARVLHVT
jgi:hypothetical protein